MLNERSHTKILLFLGVVAFLATAAIKNDAGCAMGIAYGLFGWLRVLHLEK